MHVVFFALGNGRQGANKKYPGRLLLWRYLYFVSTDYISRSVIPRLVHFQHEPVEKTERKGETAIYLFFIAYSFSKLEVPFYIEIQLCQSCNDLVPDRHTF